MMDLIPLTISAVGVRRKLEEDYRSWNIYIATERYYKLHCSNIILGGEEKGILTWGRLMQACRWARRAGLQHCIRTTT